MRQLLANPVLARELRGRIRGLRSMIILTIYLGIIGLVTLLIYMAGTSSFSGGTNDPEAGRSIGKAIFLTVMTVSLIQVCLITPSLTAGAIVGEKERQSYDLLISTLLSPLQIALGKLASALAFAMLLILAALPIAGLAFLFGGVSGTELLIGLVGLVVTAVSYATVGLFWSAMMRSTLAATVMAQGTVIAIQLAVPFLFFIITLLLDAFSGTPDPLYIYAMGLLLCTQPFIALGMTAGFLSNGDSPIFLSIPSSAGDLIAPSPWIVYIVVAAAISAVCLTLAVRLIRPAETA